MKFVSIALVVWLCASASSLADSMNSPVQTSVAPAQRYLERLSAQSSSPGVSAAVMVNGQVVFSGGVGVADLESQEPQTGSTVHNIGSLSKTQLEGRYPIV